jgi:hypothetical protein
MGVYQMITYLHVFFLPGAAGTFFARCLSLASDQCVGQIASSATTPYMSLQEKYSVYQYGSRHQYSNWIDFEKTVVHYSNCFEHHALESGTVSIWHSHPSYDVLAQNIAGADDQQVLVYIDASDAFEWCMLNALYKDSYIQKKWLLCAQQMLSDTALHKINLSNIITSADTLLQCVQQVCDLAHIEIKSENQTQIRKLWHEWIKTTLAANDFEEFKATIGYSCR